MASSAFRWTLPRSGSSVSLGVLDGAGGSTGFLGFVSHVRVPTSQPRRIRESTLDVVLSLVTAGHRNPLDAARDVDQGACQAAWYSQ